LAEVEASTEKLANQVDHNAAIAQEVASEAASAAQVFINCLVLVIVLITIS
jgi:hypothetical protein